MNPNQDHSIVNEDRLVEIIAECMERQDHGEPVNREEVLRQHPDLAKPLREYFAGADFADEIASSLTSGIAASRRDSVSFSFAPDSTSILDQAGKQGQQPPSPTRVVPTRIGRYEILKPLGQGGMGTVYLVHDTTLKRDVALKLPRFDGDVVTETRARFLVEAQALAKLDHQNICRILEYGEIDGTPFCTMDYLKGDRLTDHNGQHGIPIISDAVSIVLTIADAMQTAHQAGIFHRDLKPTNIIIDEQRGPVIVDFGLAHDTHTADTSRLTHTGLVVGTVGYMSPEQLGGERKGQGAGMDIWSLGIILHELLTGRQPFQGSQTDVIAQILRDPPPKPSHQRPEVDPRLDAICFKMLEKKAEDRYTSMAEVSAALGGYLDHDTEREAINAAPAVAGDGESSPSSAVTTVAPALDSKSVFSSRPKRRAAIAALIAVAVLCMVWVGATFYVKAGPQTVTFEIDDDILRDSELTVFVDKKLIEIRKNGQTIPLESGKHTWTVKRGAFVVNNGPFEIRQDEDPRPPVRVSLRDDAPAADVPEVAGFKEDLEYREVGERLNHAREPVDVFFGASDRTLIVADSISVKAYDLSSGTVSHKLRAESVEPVRSIAKSADGRTLAAIVGSDVRLWSLVTFEEKKPLPLNSDSTSIIGLNQDGSRLIAVFGDGTISRFDTKTGERMEQDEKLPHEDKFVALSPDTTRCVTAHSDKTVTLWNLKEGRVERTLSGYENRVESVAFSPDEKHLATGDRRGEIRVWNVATGELVYTLANHSSAIASLSFSPDGTHLVSGSEDNTLRIWEIATGSEKMLRRFSNPVEHVTFAPVGLLLAVSVRGEGTAIGMLPSPLGTKAAGMRLIATLFHRDQFLQALAISPDGRFVAAAGLGNHPTEKMAEIRIWEVATRTLARTLPTRIKDFIKRLRYSPDGSQLVAFSAEAGSMFQFWDLPSGELLRPFDGVDIGSVGRGRVHDFDFLSTGSELILVGKNGQQIVDASNLRVLSAWQEQGEDVTSVTRLPGRPEILTGAQNGLVKAWNTVTLRRLRTWRAKERYVDLLTSSSDGQMALVGAMRQYELWDSDPVAMTSMETSSLKLHSWRRSASHGSFVQSVGALAPDGNRLLLATVDAGQGRLHLIDAASGLEIADVPAHAGAPRAVAITADGSYAASAGQDGTVKLWKLPDHVDRNRPAAEWVLKQVREHEKDRTVEKGAQVRVVDQHGRRVGYVQQLDDLPEGDLQCIGVTLNGINDISSDDLRILSGLTKLNELQLIGTRINDDVLSSLQGLPRLQILHLGETLITDAGMDVPARFPNLKRLSLRKTLIGNEALPKLIALRSLRSLDLGRTRIDDAALPYLRGFPNLNILYLDGTRITDAGLQHLQTLASLTLLDCRNTSVTADAVTRLKNTIPHLEIRTGIEKDVEQ